MLALQVVLATAEPDRVVLDCVLVDEVRLGRSCRIPAGAVFALAIEHDPGSAVQWAEHPAALLLDRWCESGAVVHAWVSWWSSCLVLRHEREELLLAVC
jgi:hypothetical protein